MSVDFGTSWSGWAMAYSHKPEDIFVDAKEAQRRTCVLFKEDSKGDEEVLFGDQAFDHFNQLLDYRGVYFFDRSAPLPLPSYFDQFFFCARCRFKMQLHNEQAPHQLTLTVRTLADMFRFLTRPNRRTMARPRSQPWRCSRRHFGVSKPRCANGWKPR